MAKTRVGDLELSQDLAFQRRDWAVQRVSWALMALVLIASLAGVFGRGGPFASGSVHTGDAALHVEYERFPHVETPTTLTVRFGEAAVKAGEARLWLDRRYLERMTVRQVRPQPARVELGTERLTYVFAARGASAVSFELMPRRFGPLHAAAGVEGGPDVRFRQLVYP